MTLFSQTTGGGEAVAISNPGPLLAIDSLALRRQHSNFFNLHAVLARVSFPSIR